MGQRSPDEIMREFSHGAAFSTDVRMHELLFEVIADVQSSYRMALEGLGLNPASIETVEETVNDYIANHYGEDS